MLLRSLIKTGILVSAIGLVLNAVKTAEENQKESKPLKETKDNPLETAGTVEDAAKPETKDPKEESQDNE